MTNLEKLEQACTANNASYRDISINTAYLWAGLAEYNIMFWKTKDLGVNGFIKLADYKTAKKTSSKMSKQGYFGKINVYVKDSSELLAYNLWSFGNLCN